MVYNMSVTMFLLFVVFRLCVLLCYACKNTVFLFLDYIELVRNSYTLLLFSSMFVYNIVTVGSFVFLLAGFIYV